MQQCPTLSSEIVQTRNDNHAFSDLLRMNLLKRHGGIWLDSTILLTKDIDSIINTSLPYYSHHHIPNNCNVVKVNGPVSFLLAVKAIFSPLSSWMLSTIIGKQQPDCNLSFIDYLFALAYKHIPAVSKW